MRLPLKIAWIPLSRAALRLAAALSIAAVLFSAQTLFRADTGHDVDAAAKQSWLIAATPKQPIKSREKVKAFGLMRDDSEEKVYPHGHIDDVSTSQAPVVHSTSDSTPAWFNTELEKHFDNAMPYLDGLLLTSAHFVSPWFMVPSVPFAEERVSYCLHGLPVALPKSVAALGVIAIDSKTASCLSSNKPLPVENDENSRKRGRESTMRRKKKPHFLRVGMSSDSFDKARQYLGAENDVAVIATEENNIQLHLPSINVDMIMTRIIQPSDNGTDFWLYPAISIRGFEQPTFAILQPPLSQVFPVHDGGIYAPFDGSLYAWQLVRGRYITCNENLAQEFEKFEWSEDLKNDSRDAYYKPNSMWTIATAHLRDMMYRIRVPIMLSMGTLLGWYRNCGWIPYTTDVDVAFFGDDYTPEIERVLRDDTKFWLRHIFGLPWEGYEITIMYERSHNTDLFAFYNEGNMTWVGSTNNAQPADLPKYRWYFPRIKSSLCVGALQNRLFFVPCETEQFLAAMYGKTWQRPKDNHGVAGAYRNNGFWPNSTRHLTERKYFIVCWNGGTERDAAGTDDACDCAPGFTGRYCTMRVPALHEELRLQQQAQATPQARLPTATQWYRVAADASASLPSGATAFSPAASPGW